MFFATAWSMEYVNISADVSITTRKGKKFLKDFLSLMFTRDWWKVRQI